MITINTVINSTIKVSVLRNPLQIFVLYSFFTKSELQIADIFSNDRKKSNLLKWSLSVANLLEYSNYK